MAASGATLGKLPEFNSNTGDFEVHLERLECFMTINDIAEEKKLRVFLTTISEKDYGTLKSLLLSKTPTKVTFEVAEEFRGDGKVNQQLGGLRVATTYKF
ncbi:hypothetical protein HPB50_014477 [Hyalomma asiaticum]|uniref:Uncharacterized protein n=1 Tax=Hyalomma asiaticum TaxID=266040 RepID=A0ACB7SSS7_HYAAI|nr:hypothetical protein HPB50_014477 [Hyalomma asiaticum]